MDINELNKICHSHLVQTLDKRFDLIQQRSISLKDETRKNNIRIIYATIVFVSFILLPIPEGDPRYLTGKIVLGILSLIFIFGIINYIRKFNNFLKPRTLDEIQAYYSAIFLQTTDKYKTTPRDRNRSLKRAFTDNRELFPYPLFNNYTKDGYKKYLYEWDELLRAYPLWKMEICAIRMMFTNYSSGNIRYIRIEIDYRMEEKLKTLTLYNAIIDLKDIFFLVTPYPIREEEY